MYQCATKDLALNLQSDKMKFPLSWQLSHRLEEFLVWPVKGDSEADKKDYFCRLYAHLREKFRSCTKFCVICDRKLAYVGLKPAVCDSALCTYRCVPLPERTLRNEEEEREREQVRDGDSCGGQWIRFAHTPGLNGCVVLCVRCAAT